MTLRAGGGNRALRIICHRNQHQRQPDRGPHDVVPIESGSLSRSRTQVTTVSVHKHHVGRHQRRTWWTHEVAGPPLARPSQASTRPRRKPGHDGRDFRQRRTTEESGSGPHQIRFSAPWRNSQWVAPDRTRVRTRLVRRRSQRPGPAPTRDPQSGHRPDDHYAGADLCALWTGDSVPVLLRQRDHAREHGQSDPRQARGPRRQSSGGGDLIAILRITPGRQYA